MKNDQNDRGPVYPNWNCAFDEQARDDAYQEMQEARRRQNQRPPSRGDIIFIGAFLVLMLTITLLVPSCVTGVF